MHAILIWLGRKIIYLGNTILNINGYVEHFLASEINIDIEIVISMLTAWIKMDFTIANVKWWAILVHYTKREFLRCRVRALDRVSISQRAQAAMHGSSGLGNKRYVS